MSSMENPPKARRGRNHLMPQSGAGASRHRGSKPSGKGKKLSFPHKTLATDVGKADTKKYRTAKLWTQHAEDVERKDTLRRFVSRGNTPHTL